MKSPLIRRLEKVERFLHPREILVPVPLSWSHLSDEEVEDRIARWREGEDFGDYDPNLKGLAAVYQDAMRSDLSIEERKQARIRRLRFVKPE